MIKYYYPDSTHCYRALHTTHAVYQSDDGKLIARTMKPDKSALYEFETLGFELLKPGARYGRENQPAPRVRDTSRVAKEKGALALFSRS